jgi:TctA family transporter
MDQVELLWKLFDDNRQYAKHHENQRASAANITMIVSAGILGLITFDRQLSLSDLPLAMFQTLVGLFGAAFSAKHYERIRLHLYRAEQYLMKIDALMPEVGIAKLRAEANQKTATRFPRLSRLQLHWFWVVLHLFLASVGAAIMGIILLGLARSA